MRTTALVGLVALAVLAVLPTAAGQVVTRTAVMTVKGPDFPSGVPRGPRGADVVVVGKVIEVESEAIEVAPFRGAPKERIVKYKVVTLQIEDRLLGAGGITRIRVGFPADGSRTYSSTTTVTVTMTAAVAGGPPPRDVSTLTGGAEGCFSLAKHATADFYVMVGPPTFKKDATYTREVDRLKTYGKAISDPVAALKAKNLNDRFDAAQIILQHYLIPQGSNAREPIPEEEDKLILALLAELPWLPPDGKRVDPDGRLVPCRSAIWFSINPNELGFKRPAMPKTAPGDPPPDMNKLMDQATSEFLKENADKIRIKRFVQK